MTNSKTAIWIALGFIVLAVAFVYSMFDRSQQLAKEGIELRRETNMLMSENNKLLKQLAETMQKQTKR